MARKKIGDVELVWTCPNCQGVNPGSAQVCESCGKPQPADVKFELPKHQALITDEAAKAKAAAGADIHCPYCGTRNPAGTKTCSHCGGDLTEGKARESGQVLGAYESGPEAKVACPHCGTLNPETARVCVNCGGSMKLEEPAMPVSAPTVPTAQSKPKYGLYAVVALAVLLLCGVIGYLVFLSGRREAVSAVVQDVRWERSIPILGLVPVQYSDWQDEIPADAPIESCQEEIRRTSSEPEPNSVEVCGTPYTVDTGGGYAEVVQDCEYQVYDQYCSYTVEEWRQVDTATLSGNDLSPVWPEPQLSSEQRLGDQTTETYTVLFAAGDQTFTYQTSDLELFQQLQTGSEWQLELNGFGDIVTIEE
jgi:ribosomal protein L40E